MIKEITLDCEVGYLLVSLKTHYRKEEKKQMETIVRDSLENDIREN